MLLNELITNSTKYAFTSGEQIKITIELQAAGKTVFIQYRDFGKGLDDDKDFFKNGNFGSMVIQILLNQLNARWNLQAKDDFNCNFKFDLSEYYGPSQNFNGRMLQDQATYY